MIGKEKNNNSNGKGWKERKKTTLRTEEGSRNLGKKDRKDTTEAASLKMVKVEDPEGENDRQSGGPSGVVEEGSSVLVGNEKNERRGKRKIAYVYGNYRLYYGYRVDRNSKQDPRLLAFKKEWFQDKDCLDIGCNQGLITISVAKCFSCRSIVGIDIDGELIEAANWTLRKMARSETSSSRLMKQCKSELVNGDFNSKQKLSQITIEEEAQFSDCGLPTKRCDLLKKVSFRKENFIERLNGSSENYDTVLCLSVSKWIHLNWGDEGLITLFVKIWRILRPGGIFLFEPQPWQSYIKNRRVSETARLNFRNIIFTPDLFEEIILDKIGFRSVENVTGSLRGTVAGFERPIFAFTK